MLTQSINYRGQVVNSTPLLTQGRSQPQWRAAGGMNASGNPYTVCALAGPYQLEAQLTPDIDQPNQLWFDAAVQCREQTPAVDSVLFLRVTPSGDPHHVLASLVSMADESSSYRHQSAIRLEQPGLYEMTVSVCDPGGAGGTITILWSHSTQAIEYGHPVATTATH